MNTAASDGPAYDEILTLAEMARYLKVSQRTLLRMVHAGEVPAGKVGGQWRFRQSAVDAWLTSRVGQTATQDLINVVAAGRAGIARIPDLLPPGRIIMHLQPGDKEEVLRQLVVPLADAHVLPDPDGYLRALLEREQMLSTALGDGIALPHARTPEEANSQETSMVCGICPQGMDFDSLDGEPTDLFFLLCATSVSAHLRLLAKVTVMLRNPEVTNGLRAARDRDDVKAVLMTAQADLTMRL